MLNITAVDLSAQARNRLVEFLTAQLAVCARDGALVPQVGIKPLSFEELKFTAAPDLCIVGEEALRLDLCEIARVKEVLPHTPLIACLADGAPKFHILEQLARLGAADIISRTTSPAELITKIIFITRRDRPKKSGRLILVESAKGGVGATSICAGLSEALYHADRSVALIDLDFESQDLTRFLQVRPFINENLQLILDGRRPLSDDSIDQCLFGLWEGGAKSSCIPPATNETSLYDSQSQSGPIFLSALENIDARFDVTLVDCSHIRGILQEALYRAADQVVFVVSNDPAALYGSLEKLVRLHTQLSPGTQVVIAENSPRPFGLPKGSLRQELCRAANLKAQATQSLTVPFCRNACRWPGSGLSMFSIGSQGVQSALQGVLTQLGLLPEAGQASLLERVTEAMQGLRSSFRGKRHSAEREAHISLPSSTAEKISRDTLSLPEPELLISGAQI
ncbi:MAG: hypothetical protein DCC75_00030 [Proteobacteria bacterium]|nr:MAG: hypothetical protein DCC75_00030 [Pseudomonadota bacterium]